MAWILGQTAAPMKFDGMLAKIMAFTEARLKAKN